MDDMKQELARLGNGAHALATQILGNPEDAADAVHDAFTTVLARPEAYDGTRGPMKPWFLRLVRNRCIDQLRQRRPGGDSTAELIEPGAGPDRMLEESQRDLQLQRALRSLSAEQRQIVVLRDFLDLSYAEIADVLEIPAGTVMSRLHRARLALKTLLEQQNAE